MEFARFRSSIHDRYFEDYQAGNTYEFGPLQVEEADIIAFAEKFDPQTMHVDPKKALDGPYGGLIASGFHTTSILMRLYVDHYLSAVGSLASPGLDKLRWLRPVRPKDQLRLRVSILSARLSQTKPDRGLVISSLEGINQNQEIVCSMQGMNLFLTRPAS